MQLQQQVTLVYAVPNTINQDGPVQLVFHARTDGQDYIVTASIPSADQLLNICDQQGWVKQSTQQQFSQFSQQRQRQTA